MLLLVFIIFLPQIDGTHSTSHYYHFILISYKLTTCPYIKYRIPRNSTYNTPKKRPQDLSDGPKRSQ